MHLSVHLDSSGTPDTVQSLPEDLSLGCLGTDGHAQEAIFFFGMAAVLIE